MRRDFVTVQELATILKLSVCTVYKQVGTGAWGYEQGVRRVGGRIIFHWPLFEGTVLNHWSEKCRGRLGSISLASRYGCICCGSNKHRCALVS